MTAISDATLEDRLISALDLTSSQELSLDFRTTSPHSLISFLQSRETEVRRVILHDSFFSVREVQSALEKEAQSSATVANLIFINVEDIEIKDPAGVRDAINASIRISHDRGQIRRTLEPISHLIAVTGTSGAPGVTSVAMNLAATLAQSSKISLVDANPRREDIAYLFGAHSSHLPHHLSPNLQIAAEIMDSAGKVTTIVDCGSIFDFTTASTDRRADVRRWFELVEMSETLIFVAQPEVTQLREVQAFVAGSRKYRPHKPTTYVLNGLGSSQLHRNVRKRFSASISPDRHFVIPYDRELFEKAKSEMAAITEVASKGRVQRAFLELADSLSGALAH